MTGLGEDVYEDRTTALDALTAESEWLGMYRAGTDASGMVEKAARPIYEEIFAQPSPSGIDHEEMRWCGELARAAILSLGLPLEDLAWAAENAAVVRALARGEWVAVPKVLDETMAITYERGGGSINQGDYGAMLAAAPKSPSEEV